MPERFDPSGAEVSGRKDVSDYLVVQLDRTFRKGRHVDDDEGPIRSSYGGHLRGVQISVECRFGPRNPLAYSSIISP
jgi:hypothetical protein